MNTNVLKITYKKDTEFYGIYYGNDISKNKIYFLELFNRFNLNLNIANKIEIPINISGDNKVSIPNIISIELLSPDNLNIIIENYKKFTQKLITSYNEDSTKIIKSINDKLPTEIKTNIKINSEITEYTKDFVTINGTELSKITNKNNRLIGISNNGNDNICYLNTLIQMLKQIDEVYYYFTQIIETDNYFLKALIFLFINENPNNTNIRDNQKIIVNEINKKDPDFVFGIGNDIIDTFRLIMQIINELHSPHNFNNHIIKLYNSFLLNFIYCNSNILNLTINKENQYIDLRHMSENNINISELLNNEQSIQLININERSTEYNCETKQFKKSIYLVTDETKYIFINIPKNIEEKYNETLNYNEIIEHSRPITIDEFIELYDETGKKVKFYPKSTAMHSQGHYVFATLENDNRQIVFNTIIDDPTVIKKKMDDGTINPKYNPIQYNSRNYSITESPVLILYEREQNP
jgi:hypothetical protein